VRVDHGHADLGPFQQGGEQVLFEHRYSRSPLRIALATAAARSETPSFS
jgi:hypothetical protein